MDPFSALLLGSTALSGGSSILGGLFGSKKAKKASRLQAANEAAAIQDMINAGKEYNTSIQTLAEDYNPYVESGLGSLGAFDRLVSNPSSLRSLPGYQFAQDEGLRAVDSSAARRGMLNSGRNIKDTLRFSQGLADQTYGDQFSRLFNASGRGMDAISNRANLKNTGYSGLFSAKSRGANLGYSGAGTIPAGMIAGANAKIGGIQGGFDALLSGIGQFRGSSFAQPSFASPSFGGLY